MHFDDERQQSPHDNRRSRYDDYRYVNYQRRDDGNYTDQRQRYDRSQSPGMRYRGRGRGGVFSYRGGSYPNWNMEPRNEQSDYNHETAGDSVVGVAEDCPTWTSRPHDNRRTVTIRRVLNVGTTDIHIPLTVQPLTKTVIHGQKGSLPPCLPTGKQRTGRIAMTVGASSSETRKPL